MGKYIFEVMVIVLVAIFLAPFVIVAVSRLRKEYMKTIEEREDEKDSDAS